MLTPAEWETLSSATEDLCGMWEILWRFNTIFPEMPADERVRLAEAVTRRLVSDGLIEVYRVDRRRRPGITMGEAKKLSPEAGEEALSRVDETYPDDVLLSSDETYELLADPSIWEPADPVYIGFIATKKGKDVYNATPPPDRPYTI